MARTLTVGNALNTLARKFPLLDSMGARFADEIVSFMWTKYPWRESIEELPPFHLTQDEHDYGPPLLAVPADYLSLHTARVRNSSGFISPPLTVKNELTITDMASCPDTIAYQKSTGSFRLHPVPNVGGADWWVEGEYKKTLDKITNENINSYVLPWDDLYFQVFRAGLMWKIKDELQSDPRAIQQFAMFQQLLMDMAVSEGAHEGERLLAPEEGFDSY